MDVHIKPISVETMKQRYTEALADLQCAKDRIAELERMQEIAAAAERALRAMANGERPEHGDRVFLVHLAEKAIAKERERLIFQVIEPRREKEKNASDTKVGSMPDVAQQHEEKAILCTELIQAIRALEDGRPE